MFAKIPRGARAVSILLLVPLIVSVRPSAADEREPVAPVSLEGVPPESGAKEASRHPGWLLELANGTERFTKTASTPHLALAPGESLDPRIGTRFTATWRGELLVHEPGEYVFDAPDARLEISGRTILDPGSEDAPTTGEPGRIRLAAGYHAVVLRRRHDGQRQESRLRWRGPGFIEEPVPASRLFHGETDRDAASELASEGAELFERLRCGSCHRDPIRPRRAGPGGSASDLSRIAAGLKPGWLRSWLRDPDSSPGHRTMPRLLEPGEEIPVAAFLERLAARGEGAPQSSAAPAGPPSPHDIARGQARIDEIGCLACHDASLPLEHVAAKWRRDVLAEYLREPEAFAASGAMPAFDLDRESAEQIAAALAPSLETASSARANAFPVDEALLAEGKRLVLERRCFACHAIPLAEGVEESALFAGSVAWRDGKALERSFVLLPRDRESGCLSVREARERPEVPEYRLTSNERAALSVHVRREPVTASNAPAFDLESRLRRLRCVACHERHGTEPSAVIAERIPSLSGVGGRLREAWIDRVLLDGARSRPELRTRMPRFAPALVRGLAAALTRADGYLDPPLEASREATPTASPQLVARAERGIALLGRDAARGGLACIACHDWGEYTPISDEKGPQLRTGARFRRDWLRRFLLEPARVSPGTTMPSFFSSLDPAAADEAVDAIAAAFSLVESSPAPSGVDEPLRWLGTETHPSPGTRAVVVRYLLPGTTAAGIAVGLPRQPRQPVVSYAFDAADCRLVHAWRGGFLDLSESLTKSQERPTLLGEIFHRRAAFPFRVARPGLSEDEALASPESMPAPERRFRGYRLRDDVVEFSYDVDGVRVTDCVRPTRTGGLLEEFEIERIESDWWLLLPPESALRVTTTVGEIREGVLRLPRGERVRFDLRIEPPRIELPGLPGGGKEDVQPAIEAESQGSEEP